MSRRRLMLRDGLGYDSADGVKGEAKGYHRSQCGGLREKFESRRRGAPRTRPRCGECGKRIRSPLHVDANPGRHPAEIRRRIEEAKKLAEVGAQPQR